MSILFFTRRAYNASNGKFSNNPASLTRYVSVDQIDDNIHSGFHMPADDWKAKVLAQAAGGPILCFVHGFNTLQSDMLRRMQKIETGLKANGFRGAVVAFDWPSNGQTLQYLSDRNDAKSVAPYLVVGGLGLFMNAAPKPKLHIIAHSMGALVTLRGFARTGDGGSAPWGVDEVLFVAADTDSEELAAGVGASLVMEKRAKRLTNYYSNQDQVLALSGGLVHGGRDRLGFRGMPEHKAASHHDVYCGRRYVDVVPDADKTQTYSHSWLFDDPLLYQDAAATLTGKPASAMTATRAPVAGATKDQALKS